MANKLRGSVFLFAVTFATISQFVVPAETSNILGYLIAPVRSHFIVHNSLLLELANRGHNVTVVGIFPPPKASSPNYNYIQLQLSAEDSNKMESIKSFILNGSDTGNRLMQMISLFSIVSDYTNIMENTLTNPAVEHLKRTARFDLVVFGWIINDYQYGIAAHFECPSIVISSTIVINMILDIVANPANFAAAPPVYLGHNPSDGSPGFRFRFLSFLAYFLELAQAQALEHIFFQPIYKRNFPSDRYPSLDEVRRNISLVLATSHFSNSAPLATYPALIEVGGMHIEQHANPLPDSIRDWLDAADEHGAIFFSMGTNLNSADLPAEKLAILLTVFGQLKQRVLWKWEDANLPNRPENVMVGAWMPQSDILAHRNVRAFVSHCGKGSVTEAKYHGVPILAMPMFSDQPFIAKGIVDERWAVLVDYATLTEQSLMAGLREILENQTYRNVVRGAADLYRDRPEHPMEKAVFWTEYVLRHAGAKHMQSYGVHLNWFQRNSLDVYAVLAIVAFVCCRLWMWIFGWVWRKWRSGSAKSSSGRTEKVKRQ